MGSAVEDGPALVTGASGFLGWHVARALKDRGRRVRVLLRPGSEARDLDAETVRGDLRDPASLGEAVRGCAEVYHVAADYRLWARNPKELYDSNVTGTRNLLDASWRAGVAKFVYTSTVGCIGMPAGKLGDEDAPVSLDEMSGDYKRSKFLAEQAALEQASAGRPVYIVNPTAPIGERDVKPTPTGRIILDFLRGGMPAYVDTGLNFADVRGCAEGHLLAALRGRPGERYILGGENWTLKQLLDRLAEMTGLKAPSFRIPYGAAYLAGLASTAWADLTGREPRAPIEGVRMARKKMWVSSAKAERELGYRPGPVEDALARAVRWFRGNGYC